MAKMKFGGPGLPKGTHTFYTVNTPDGAREYRAEIGDEVEFDKVVGGQQYLDLGLASLVGEVAVVKTKEEE